MLGRQRTLRLAVATAVMLVSGGTAAAFAATGGLPGHTAGVHATEVTDSSTVDPTTDSTAVDDSTSTTVEDDSTSTTVADDTTSTTVEDDTTSTTMADDTTSTTVAETPTTVCKPGWGYGDTNHCHSGPPGQATGDENEGAQHPSRNEHAGDHGQGQQNGHGHGEDDGNEAGGD
jgi:hypothetical protein